jgi:hypothetical protein
MSVKLLADARLVSHAELFTWLEISVGSAERAALIEALLHDHAVSDVPLLRALIDLQTSEAEKSAGCGDLYALAFMLYRLGDPSDVVRLVRAKQSNMDSGCMIDLEMLTMREPDASRRLPHLENKGAWANDLVRAAFANREVTTDEFVAQISQYFDI